MLQKTLATVVAIVLGSTVVSCAKVEELDKAEIPFTISSMGPIRTAEHVTVPVRGVEREFYVYASPEASNGDLPVIFAFHGRGSSAQSFANATGLHESQAIVIYPEGIEQSWAPAYYRQDHQGDDLAFMDALSTWAQETYGVEQDQMMATGHSNGGGFVRYVSCQRPGMFSAITTMSGAMYEEVVEDCHDPGTDYLNIHAAHDPVVEYEGDTRRSGGKTYSYLAVPDVLEQAAELNECDVAPAIDAEATVQREVYACETARLEHVKVASNSHSWLHKTPVDSTTETLEFFDIDYSG
ncbi:alpha/beta hydrolase-fold protein [Corynebacterium breve]|uniref:Alpha/beta hydrolase-fold protein n=1 Tax=Corynebacterium breve TaxID=3049799 RepID=A0ABY8VKT0_9CORY|nr:alpha/beta hydrolase-fold protein [Corynebacterium breve]WIM68794.1 alpha/beta hydrolase-fold protein [Corynebacterium breve]